MQMWEDEGRSKLWQLRELWGESSVCLASVHLMRSALMAVMSWEPSSDECSLKDGEQWVEDSCKASILLFRHSHPSSDPSISYSSIQPFMCACEPIRHTHTLFLSYSCRTHQFVHKWNGIKNKKRRKSSLPSKTKKQLINNMNIIML